MVNIETLQFSIRVFFTEVHEENLKEKLPRGVILLQPGVEAYPDF